MRHKLQEFPRIVKDKQLLKDLILGEVDCILPRKGLYYAKVLENRKYWHGYYKVPTKMVVQFAIKGYIVPIYHSKRLMLNRRKAQFIFDNIVKRKNLKNHTIKLNIYQDDKFLISAPSLQRAQIIIDKLFMRYSGTLPIQKVQGIKKGEKRTWEIYSFMNKNFELNVIPSKSINTIEHKKATIIICEYLK